MFLEKDLFFLRKDELVLFQNDLQGALVIPRAEFFQHSSYNGIQMVNSYMYWMISKDAELCHCRAATSGLLHYPPTREMRCSRCKLN